jgi:hypothetical protein
VFAHVEGKGQLFVPALHETSSLFHELPPVFFGLTTHHESIREVVVNQVQQFRRKTREKRL